MSILIKGMEIPTEGQQKSFLLHFNDDGTASIVALGYPQKPYKVVSVPPHGDLIDREPFIDFIKTHWDSYDQWFVDQLEARPTIIPAEED